MTWKDPIVEEVRAARDAYAKQFDYDLERMFADLKKSEEQNDWPKADLKPVRRSLRKPVRAARSVTTKPRRRSASR